MFVMCFISNIWMFPFEILNKVTNLLTYKLLVHWNILTVMYICSNEVLWLWIQVAERHDNIVKLRNENRDIEEKLREALASASHRGEVIKQLRDKIKQYQRKVSSVYPYYCSKWMIYPSSLDRVNFPDRSSV